MKILHTADIHLGDLTGPTKEGKNLRRQDTIACMKHIVAIAEAERPHLSIIAGDIFNRSRVWADTALDDVNDAISLFIRPLCRCSERVVLLFGTDNHDNPRAFDTIKETTANELNLHIYTAPQVEELQTSEGPVQILAVPGFDRGRLRLFCPTADKEEENRNATALINDVIIGLAGQLDRSKPAVMVAHYTVAGSEADNGSTFMAGQDVVILPSTIDVSHVDLACLGHIHRPQRLACDVPAFYCGSPNQLNFNDEANSHGFYLHSLTRTAPGASIPDGVEHRSHDCGDGTHWQYAHEHQFITTPERRHYTLHLDQEGVGHFIRTGELQEIPEQTKDAIVRVRYTCTAEQDKAFNRAELQKRLIAAGAFYVAEVLPEDVEDDYIATGPTEHDGPAETLNRWLDANGITGQDAERLREMAAPIIKKADDGRDASKHTGSFVPLRIEVKNYRSYTEAVFDFSDIRMAMVNGPNGVGKSSLFMDAIADCLYEQTRKEDIGGWVRDGTKSGAVTFEFLMGKEAHRVIRTRTKSGRGTLALHRKNIETGEWEDESDTTMRLTQQKIEQLLGMDCNTFCSVALIRQDAYGLFLEADSDRRMEVLSAILGLDIYGRMEELAKAEATAQRRKIAAANERIAILNEQIAAKEQLAHDDEAYAGQAAAAKAQAAITEERIAAAQREEAMRQEITRQADEKAREATEYGLQATAKGRQADETRLKVENAKKLSAATPAAEKAAEAVEQARAQLEQLAPQEEQLRSLRQEASTTRSAIDTAQAQAQSLASSKEALASVIARKAEIEAAQKAIDALKPARAEAETRVQKSNQAAKALREAKEARDAFLAESRIRIGQQDAKLKAAEEKTTTLANSGCPIPDTATCRFLSAAVEAKAELPALKDALATMKAADKAAYAKLDEAYKTAKTAADATGDPAADLMGITAQEAQHAKTAALGPKLAAAEAKLGEIDAQITQAQQQAETATKKLQGIETGIADLSPVEKGAADARGAIRANEALAGTLAQCKAAGATVAALEPQVAQYEQEAQELQGKQALAIIAADEIKARIPEATGDALDTLQAQKEKLTSQINELAGLRGGIRAKLEAIAEAEQQAKAKRAEKETLARTLNDYTTLAQAFGLDGIQYMIIRSIVPEIMKRANDILAAMTAGRMAVDIRTEKEQKSTQKVVNSLEVWISSITGSVRPYQSHSGGEKVKIALAVTLGLADIKARRAGLQLGMLFIDEPPFLDQDGTEAYADALTNMAARNPSMRILAISHDPTMKARFSQNITVSAGEGGSTVTTA